MVSFRGGLREVSGSKRYSGSAFVDGVARRRAPQEVHSQEPARLLNQLRAATKKAAKAAGVDDASEVFDALSLYAIELVERAEHGNWTLLSVAIQR